MVGRISASANSFPPRFGSALPLHGIALLRMGAGVVLLSASHDGARSVSAAHYRSRGQGRGVPPGTGKSPSGRNGRQRLVPGRICHHPSVRSHKERPVPPGEFVEIIPALILGNVIDPREPVTGSDGNVKMLGVSMAAAAIVREVNGMAVLRIIWILNTGMIDYCVTTAEQEYQTSDEEECTFHKMLPVCFNDDEPSARNCFGCCFDGKNWNSGVRCDCCEKRNGSYSAGCSYANGSV